MRGEAAKSAFLIALSGHVASDSLPEVVRSVGPGMLRRKTVAVAGAAAVSLAEAHEVAAVGMAALCLMPLHAGRHHSVAVAIVLAGHEVCPAVSWPVVVVLLLLLLLLLRVLPPLSAGTVATAANATHGGCYGAIRASSRPATPSIVFWAALYHQRD